MAFLKLLFNGVFNRLKTTFYMANSVNNPENS